jgi:hypothetical protein
MSKETADHRVCDEFWHGTGLDRRRSPPWPTFGTPQAAQHQLVIPTATPRSLSHTTRQWQDEPATKLRWQRGLWKDARPTGASFAYRRDTPKITYLGSPDQTHRQSDLGTTVGHRARICSSVGSRSIGSVLAGPAVTEPLISWIVTLPAGLSATEPGALEPPTPALLL